MIRTILGHNATELPRLAPMRFALAYLDPPFFSQRRYLMPDGSLAFDDRWPSLSAYLGRLAAVVHEVRDRLIPEGSLVLHVDSKVSHYAKVMLDSVFGADHFAAEIVWRYRRWPTKTANFQRVHDTLLRYRRDVSVMPRFVQLYEPLSPKTVKTWGTLKQKAIWVPEKGAADKPQRDRRRSSKTGEQSPGVPLGDVWDIGIVAGFANERTGYPTQKPEALLERLVPGDFVLDPYMGSGTTLAVCKRLGRGAVGIDSSEGAHRTAVARLEKVRAASAA